MNPIFTIGATLVLLVGLGLAFLFVTPGTPSDAAPLAGQTGEEANTSNPLQLLTLPDIPAVQPKPDGKPYKEIANPSGFVNTDAITIGELVGKKVILVDFMTYSCINCQRTFPYLNAWYAKYKDDGFVIVGIHTPEFAFEKDIGNVREAMQKFGIMHPVVLDNDYATWRAYGNNYWPRKYLIDIYGNIVYDHIGEGAYEETERKIQELLKERATVLGVAGMENGELAASEIPETQIQAGSPETYFGASRNLNFGSGLPGISGERNFDEPAGPKANTLYLSGTWDIENEFASSVKDSRVTFLYAAKSAYFVAGASPAAEMEVRLDGAAVPSAMKGADVYFKNGKSFITVGEHRLYKVIEGNLPESHLLQFIVPAGLKAYTFTFG